MSDVYSGLVEHSCLPLCLKYAEEEEEGCGESADYLHQMETEAPARKLTRAHSA